MVFGQELENFIAAVREIDRMAKSPERHKEMIDISNKGKPEGAGK